VAHGSPSDKTREQLLEELSALRAEADALRERNAFLMALIEGNNGSVSVKDEMGCDLMINSAGAALLGMTARDITSRKRADEASREAEEFLSRLLDHTPAPIYVTTADGRIRLVNRSWEEVFGMMRGEVIGRPVEQLFSPELARRFLDQNRRVVESVVPIAFEEEADVPAGRISLHTVKFPLRDAMDRVEAIGGISFDISERKRAEAVLRVYSERLRVLSRRVVEVQEEERRHLSRELHDKIGQALTAIGINLQTLKRSSATAIGTSLEECIGTVDGAIGQVRHLALDLRPSMLDDLGLVAALRWDLDRQAQLVGYQAVFHADPDEIPLDPLAAIIAFRVAQEALSNVARHSRASQVTLRIRVRGRILRLEVLDDGVGFDPEEKPRAGSWGAGLGLLGMRERAALIGGRVRIRSAPGLGTDVRLTIPLGRRAERA
jgi:PAS domain S-box-containing protein